MSQKKYYYLDSSVLLEENFYRVVEQLCGDSDVCFVLDNHMQREIELYRGLGKAEEALTLESFATSALRCSTPLTETVTMIIALPSFVLRVLRSLIMILMLASRLEISASIPILLRQKSPLEILEKLLKKEHFQKMRENVFMLYGIVLILVAYYMFQFYLLHHALK